MNKNETDISIVLSRAAGTLSWLHECGAVSAKDLSEERTAEIKPLEKLGLISRSGSGVLRIQKQRLRRLLLTVVSYAPRNEMLLSLSPYDQLSQ
jgi:hypothetical protein